MKGHQSSFITEVLVLSLISMNCLTGCLDTGQPSSGTLQTLNSNQFAIPPKIVNVKIRNYRPLSAAYRFKDLFVSNFSVTAAQGAITYSSSNDGLSDDLKAASFEQYGFTAGSPYSNPSGFSDLFLYLTGITFSQQSLFSCFDTQSFTNSANDAFYYTDPNTGNTFFLGLHDCERRFLSLDVTLFDNAGDGIPDYLKIRCKINPKNAIISKLAISTESVTNYDKCKRHIPIDENSDSQPNLLYAYNYNFETNADGSMTLNVSNIPILNDGAQNFLGFYLVETNPVANTTAVYTAFSVLNRTPSGSTFSFDYWVTDATHRTNQQLVAQ